LSSQNLKQDLTIVILLVLHNHFLRIWLARIVVMLGVGLPDGRYFTGLAGILLLI